MTEQINPVLQTLLISPIAATLPPDAPTTALVQQTHGGSSKSAWRKMHFDCATQVNILSLQTLTAAQGRYVGELQEKWQFPSDHLPIGMTLNGLHLASWNVLNAAYMNWVIEKNSQGLSRSLIAQEHLYMNDSGLTLRDQHVIELILSMLEHPTHPRALLSLQECSEPMLLELQKRLPEHVQIIVSSNDPHAIDQNVVIYDSQILTYLPTESGIITGVFSTQPERSLMDLAFSRNDTQEKVRVINAHLPGDPSNPAPIEFAAYVVSRAQPGIVTIAMGDMNFNEVEMASAFEEAAGMGNFEMLAPYCTNVGLNLHSKSIDQFFVLAPDQVVSLSENPADDVLIGLKEHVDLL